MFHFSNSSSGFSILELMVAMMISGIFLLALGKMLNDTQVSYQAQSEILEVNQNAQYTINKLSDALMEAGATLPSGGWNIIETASNPSDSFKVHINPEGGYQVIQQSSITTNKIPVDNGAGFSKALKIKYIPYNPVMFKADLNIETSYNSNGYVDGIKTVSGSYDSVKVTTTKTFYKGDTIYSYSSHNYYKNGTNLYYNNEIFAENIDTLAITFLDASHSITSNWDNMAFIDIKVTARSLSNNTLSVGDGYRRSTLSKKFRLKNKI